MKIIFNDKPTDLRKLNKIFPRFIDLDTKNFNTNDPIYNDDYYSDRSGSLANISIKDIDNFSWEKAINYLFSGNKDALIRAFSKNRINWLSHIPISLKNKNPKALEIGPGYGAVARSISEFYDLTVIDKDPNNCNFIFNTSLKDNKKINVIKKRSIPLPFEDEQFDLIYLIGSFEWLAVDNKSVTENPKLYLLKYLKEIFRVLKKGGNLYISSENASYIGYYFGLKEAHTLIPYISLLKQDIANIKSQSFIKKNFAEITYNPNDLSNQIVQLGFKDIDILWLYPDYANPAYIVSLSKTPHNLIENFFNQRINPWDFHGERESYYNFFRLLDKSLLSNFIEHYGIIATK